MRGRAAPFFWAAPGVGITGTDVTAYLESYIKASGVASVDLPFFLPDFSPKRADYALALGFSRLPMSQQDRQTTAGLITCPGCVHFRGVD